MAQQGFVSFRDLEQQAQTQAPQVGGYWEDKGIAGAEWHPPAGDGSEATRPDASILGVPPELAILPALGVGRAVVGAGAGAASKAVAGAKALVSQTAPAVTYETTRTVLQGIGVPPALATALALAVSGYRRGSAPKSTSAKAQTAPAAPAAATPAAQASPAASSARTAASGSSVGSGSWSPQRIQNEVGLAARRAKASLSKEQYAEADVLVKQGTSPAEAVRAVVARTPASSAPQAPKSQVAKPKLSVEEGRVYVQLRDGGKTHEEALKTIEAMRTLTQRHATPSTNDVIGKVVERNVTGRWGK